MGDELEGPPARGLEGVGDRGGSVHDLMTHPPTP
jgi:hypothetical protein